MEHSNTLPPIKRSLRVPFWILAFLNAVLFAPLIGMTLSGPQILMFTHLFHAPTWLTATIFALSALTWAGLYGPTMLKDVIRPWFEQHTSSEKTAQVKPAIKRFATWWSACYSLSSSSLLTFFGGMALLHTLLGITTLPLWASIAFACVTGFVGFLAAFALSRAPLAELTSQLITFAKHPRVSLKHYKFWKVTLSVLVAGCYTTMNTVAASHAPTQLGALLHSSDLLNLPSWTHVTLGAIAAFFSIYALFAVFMQYLHRPPTHQHHASETKPKRLIDHLSAMRKKAYRGPAAVVSLATAAMLFYIIGMESHSIFVIALGPHWALVPAVLFSGCALLTLSSFSNVGMGNLQHLFDGDWPSTLGLRASALTPSATVLPAVDLHQNASSSATKTPQGKQP